MLKTAVAYVQHIGVTKAQQKKEPGSYSVLSASSFKDVVVHSELNLLGTPKITGSMHGSIKILKDLVCRRLFAILPRHDQYNNACPAYSLPTIAIIISVERHEKEGG